MSEINSSVRRQLDKAPVSYYSKDELPRSVNYDNFVITYAASVAWYGFMFGFGVTSVTFLLASLLYGESYPWLIVAIAATMSGVLIAGLSGMLSLPGSKSQFGAMMQKREEIEFEQAESSEPREFAQYNGEPFAKQRRSIRIKHSGDEFVFTGENLDKLHQWYLSGDTRIRKQASGEGSGFDRLPHKITGSNYSLALKVLRGRGLVDGNNEWTSAGVDILGAE